MSRIFLIDADAAFSRSLRASLERAGHEVFEFGNGGDAFAVACVARPDVVLLELDLPDVPGETLCRLLKAAPETSAILVVILTIRGQEKDRVRGFEAGADDYVVRPFSLRELLLRLRVLVQSKTPSSKCGEDSSSVPSRFPVSN